MEVGYVHTTVEWGCSDGFRIRVLDVTSVFNSLCWCLGAANMSVDLSVTAVKSRQLAF